MNSTRWVAIAAAIVALTLVVVAKLSSSPAVAILAPFGVTFCVLAVVAVSRARR